MGAEEAADRYLHSRRVQERIGDAYNDPHPDGINEEVRRAFLEGWRAGRTVLRRRKVPGRNVFRKNRRTSPNADADGP